MFIKIYSFINKILFKLDFKLDYIGSERYVWIKDIGIKTIIDVGANRGQSIKRWTSLLGKNTIFHCFEPLKNPFKDLKKRYGGNKKIHLHNIGLGNSDMNKDMCVLTSDDSSSLLNPTEKTTETYEMQVDKHESVSIRKLDSIRKELSVKGPILMKVDVQGFENEVFKGAEKSLKHIDIIIVELSFKEFYEGQPLFNDIYNQLVGYGFNYCGSFEQSGDPRDGKPIQQDAIFTK